jgi:hypothetical protein
MKCLRVSGQANVGLSCGSPGLADVDYHVPRRWPFAGALDEILLEKVMGRGAAEAHHVSDV